MKDIQIKKGDCLAEMENIPDKSIDLILCDPPYGVLNQAKNKFDKIIPFNELWRDYSRIIKDNGAVILFGCGMFTANLMKSNEKMWRYNLIWKKGNKSGGFLNARKMPLRNHEDIIVFYKKLPTYNPQFTVGLYPSHSKGSGTIKQTNNCYGDFFKIDVDTTTLKKFPKSVIEFPKDFPLIHPSQKPIKLLEYLIKTYTKEGETVLDSCMGSGSTLIAALKCKRKAIGIEIDEKYYNTAKLRIQKYIQEEK